MLYALTGPIGAGKTTYARSLEKQGYLLINFTDVLKKRAVDALNACGTPTTIQNILSNKEKYRPFLQELGMIIGFNDEPKYVMEACAGWIEAGRPEDAVFDNVRTWEQWKILRGMGFTLVEVVCDAEIRVQRAESMGVSRAALLSLEEHPIENMLVGQGQVVVRGDFMGNHPVCGEKPPVCEEINGIYHSSSAPFQH